MGRTMLKSALVALAIAGVGLVGCSGRHARSGEAEGEASGGAGATGAAGEGRGSTLTVKGSDTMVILAQRWAERYMQTHPGATIQVSGGGSGTGFAALINGTTDIADASRPIKDEEKTRVRQQRHAEAHETRVALDALAVYVHNDNPIQSLTLEQLRGIYTGRTRNWSELGGPSQPIVLYSRENNSGTYAYFKEHVLDDQDFAATAQTLPGTAAVINAVSRDRGGVGYGGIGYAHGVRLVKIAGADGTAVEPTLENATSGRYPLSRYLYMYTAGPPSGVAREFVSWVTSADGQRLVSDAGYYPLPGSGTTASASPEAVQR